MAINLFFRKMNIFMMLIFVFVRADTRNAQSQKYRDVSHLLPLCKCKCYFIALKLLIVNVQLITEQTQSRYNFKI